jgi:hypothetical protein
MKEIGGYFGLESLINNPFYPDLLMLNSGRNAVLYVCLARSLKKVYLPSFLCSSVSMTLQQHGIECVEYAICTDFSADLAAYINRIKADEAVLIVNYYGQLSNDDIRNCQMLPCHVIVDNTQAFFQRPLSGVDTVYSCRKFFGVPDGACLSTDQVLSDPLDQDVSMDRMTHMLGRFEGSASDYYADFKANDKQMRDVPLRKMSQLTHNLLGAIDYERVWRQRTANYACLAEALDVKNKLKLKAPAGPFAYPLLVEDGIRIRKQLAEQKIYVPLLWPNVLETSEKSSIEARYAADILPLPCDQRYNQEDMMIVVNAVRHCLI